MNTAYMNGYNAHTTGPTCADDGVGLHVLQQAGDCGVLAGIQSVAINAQVELQPAGLRVKGRLVFQQRCCLAVQLHMPGGEEGCYSGVKVMHSLAVAAQRHNVCLRG